MLNRLGTTMSQLDRYDDSNRLYAKALEIATAIGSLSEKTNLLNNHGINFQSTGRVGCHPHVPGQPGDQRTHPLHAREVGRADQPRACAR